MGGEYAVLNFWLRRHWEKKDQAAASAVQEFENPIATHLPTDKLQMGTAPRLLGDVIRVGIGDEERKFRTKSSSSKAVREQCTLEHANRNFWEGLDGAPKILHNETKRKPHKMVSHSPNKGPFTHRNAKQEHANQPKRSVALSTRGRCIAEDTVQRVQGKGIHMHMQHGDDCTCTHNYEVA